MFSAELFMAPICKDAPMAEAQFSVPPITLKAPGPPSPSTTPPGTPLDCSEPTDSEPPAIVKLAVYVEARPLEL